MCVLSWWIEFFRYWRDHEYSNGEYFGGYNMDFDQNW